jgi:hypothetical protein
MIVGAVRMSQLWSLKFSHVIVLVVVHVGFLLTTGLAVYCLLLINLLIREASSLLNRRALSSHPHHTLALGVVRFRVSASEYFLFLVSLRNRR